MLILLAIIVLSITRLIYQKETNIAFTNEESNINHIVNYVIENDIEESRDSEVNIFSKGDIEIPQIEEKENSEQITNEKTNVKSNQKVKDVKINKEQKQNNYTQTENNTVIRAQDELNKVIQNENNQMKDEINENEQNNETKKKAVDLNKIEITWLGEVVKEKNNEGE